MSDDPAAADAEGERIHALDTLASRQDRIEARLDELLARGSSSGSGGSGDDDPAAAGPSVAEQVQAELARAREAEAAERDKQAKDADDKRVRDELAKLKEIPPAEPVRRATKLLGWGAR